ncbi:DUF732 domain-containing protein [Mycolicibacterium komossense]|uniref:DUF732 domain-containing protein n=1 Tax=Mycolicibacterium komossense TaxID=1779 RepID=A0ABT3CMJ6_9MYCO|nr:DUF732 domain-containing protein [Mycolicibacterium komossense]MCV7230709.1 DUF732 domain-containing protein [Mycolicibacterium komossense]
MLREWLWAPILIGAGILFPGLAAAPVHADAGPDIAFLQVLDDQGITYSNATNIIDAGHAVCEYRSGHTLNETIAMIRRNSILDQHNAAYFVGAAEAAYCPTFLATELT